LYAEFRLVRSGLETECGYGLLGASLFHGLEAMDACEKDSMRALALRGGPYTNDECAALLDYCQSDVETVSSLLVSMLPKIDLPRALLRCRYMAAAARIEWNGVPIDKSTLGILIDRWEAIQDQLIRSIDADRGIYEGRSFRMDRFEAWLVQRDIPWP